MIAADRELESVEADLALARGRILHAHFLVGQVENGEELEQFERAAALYRKLGDARGEGESLFWVGCFHQVVSRDDAAAVPVLERAYELATRARDLLTQSYALRHLGIAEHAAGRLALARERLQESVRLRREIGFMPGVAANLVGLAYLAAAEARNAEAQALLQEARSIAEGAGSGAIVRQVEQAETRLGG